MATQAISKPFYTRVCTCCNKFESDLPFSLKACSRCKAIGRETLYCSAECQQTDWKKGDPPHKRDCGSAVQIAPRDKSKKSLLNLGLSYGKVAETALPAEYEVQPIELNQAPSEKLDYPPNTLITTTIPPVILDSAYGDYPDGVAECVIDGPTKRTIFTQPGFPHRPKQPSAKTHVIKQSSTSGLGMFATRDLKQGDLVMSERPLLVIPQNVTTFMGDRFVPSYITTAEQARQVALAEAENAYHMSLNRMFDENKSAFKALYSAHDHDGSGPIGARIRTNAFVLPEKLVAFGRKGPGHGYGAVCKNMSRINHSCRPNVTRNFDLPSFSFSVRAVRDIKKGEELSIGYCELDKPRAKRAEYLVRYGIDPCTCQACKEGPESDARRSKIHLGPMAIDREPEEIEKECLEVLALIEREGLQDHRLYARCISWLSSVYRTPQYQKRPDTHLKQAENAKKAAMVRLSSPGAFELDFSYDLMSKVAF